MTLTIKKKQIRGKLKKKKCNVYPFSSARHILNQIQ